MTDSPPSRNPTHPDRVRMEELEYFFKHVLAQEAAYESAPCSSGNGFISRWRSRRTGIPERLHEFYGLWPVTTGKGNDLEKTEEYMTKAGEEALGRPPPVRPSTTIRRL